MRLSNADHTRRLIETNKSSMPGEAKLQRIKVLIAEVVRLKRYQLLYHATRLDKLEHNFWECGLDVAK